MEFLTTPEQAILIDRLFKLAEDFKLTEIKLIGLIEERIVNCQIEDLEALFLLAVVYTRIGRNEDSLKLLNRIKELDIPNYISEEKLQLLLSRIGSFESSC